MWRSHLGSGVPPRRAGSQVVTRDPGSYLWWILSRKTQSIKLPLPSVCVWLFIDTPIKNTDFTHCDNSNSDTQSSRFLTCSSQAQIRQMLLNKPRSTIELASVTQYRSSHIIPEKFMYDRLGVGKVVV